MATKHTVWPIAGYSICSRPHSASVRLMTRSFASKTALQDDLQPHSPSETTPPPPAAFLNQRLDPRTVAGPRQEKALWKKLHKYPIGSRRRRVATQHTSNIPFEQLPYQCYQDARKFLAEDRKDKEMQIETMRARIATLMEKDASKCGGEKLKLQRLMSMRANLEELKILADSNDPIVKKKFEDGQADMNKPIYRFLADRKWRSYRRKVLLQRITQMNVIPDVLPTMDPVYDVRLAFGKKEVNPGEKIHSSLSKQRPTLTIQPFDKGRRLVTVVVVDADVPDLEKDRYTYRCHGIFANLNVSPTKTSVSLRHLSPEHVVMDWQPPTAQKGSPYHRLSVWVLQHPEGKSIDVASARKMFQTRYGFVLRRFLSKMQNAWGNSALTPVGITMFRTEWDDGMDALMKQLELQEWDVELKAKKVEPLPYRKKDGERYR